MWLPKYLGLVDYQIFLPMVLRYIKIIASVPTLFPPDQSTEFEGIWHLFAVSKAHGIDTLY